MKDYNQEVDSILENFKSIKTTKRQFYPRNFTLSKEFVSAFKKEFERLKELGLSENAALQKMSKALPFHSKS